MVLKVYKNFFIFVLKEEKNYVREEKLLVKYVFF